MNDRNYKNLITIIIIQSIVIFIVMVGGFFFLYSQILNTRDRQIKEGCADMASKSMDLSKESSDPTTMLGLYNQCVDDLGYGNLWMTISNLDTDINAIKDKLE